MVEFQNSPRLTQTEPLYEVGDPERAAFLQCRGISLLEIKPTGDGKFLGFFFAGDRVMIRRLILEYEAGVTVSAKSFAEYLKNLKMSIAAHRRGIEAGR